MSSHSNSVPMIPRLVKPIIPKPKNQNSLPIIPQQIEKTFNSCTEFSQDAVNYYYTEYMRLFKENIQLTSQFKMALKQKDELLKKYSQLRGNSQIQQKQKRFRRNASQVSRNHECPFDGCQKKYGSDGSLTQHVKLKHPLFFKSKQYQMKVNQNFIIIANQKHNANNEKKQQIKQGESSQQ